MFGRTLKYSVAVTVGVCVLLFWLLLLPVTDLADWRGSERWQATDSTSLAVAPKSSRVRYTYQVGGREYSGDRTHFFVAAVYQDERHLNWINTNRETEQVTVYYDPDAPHRAVLVRDVGADVGTRWLMTGAISTIMCLGPFLFFAVVWWWFRSQFPR